MFALLDPLSQLFAKPLEWFYALTSSYGVAIMLITVLVMIVLTPLTLKQTKSMLEMQLVQPEMRRIQNEFRGDRNAMNQEMMKLYQEHKINPLASCLPLLAQMPVFFGMFNLLRGLTQKFDPLTGNFAPRFLDTNSELYASLTSVKEMKSFGLDLAKSPVTVMGESFGRGLIYALLVVLLGALYWVQQKMVANRSASPTMSAAQQKLFQYLPIAFAPIQLFLPTGLVVYYLTQTVLRIVQQQYITQRFYKGDNALGKQAQEASAAARDAAKNDKSNPGGLLSQLKASAKDEAAKAPSKPGQRPAPSKPASKSPARPAPAKPGRVTPPAKGGAPSRSQRPTPPKGSGAPSRHPKPNKP